MLECNLCNYYSVRKGKKACEFSDHIFVKNPADMDRYPCEDITYDAYLSKNEKKKNISSVA